MSTANLITVLLVLVSLLYLLILGRIFRKRDVRQRTEIFLVGYIGLSLLWIVGQGLKFYAFIPANILSRLTLYGILLLALFFFHLNRAFLRRGGRGLPWWILGFGWIVVVAAVSEGLVPFPAAWGNVSSIQVGVWLSMAGWALAMGGSAVLTSRAYLQTHEPLHKNRLQYWILALLFTVGSGVLFFIENPVLSSGVHLLGVLIVTYAALTHNLLDIRRMVRRSVSYLIMTLFTVVIYTAGFIAVQYAFQSLPNYSPIWAGATVAVILAILFNPLLTLVRRFMRRFITGGGYDAGRIVQEYSTKINNILELDKLATVTLTHISRSLDIRRGILFVVHTELGSNGSGSNGASSEDGQFYLRSVIGAGDGLPPGASLPNGTLSAGEPVGDYLYKEEQPLTQYDIDMLPRFQEMVPEEQAWLTNLKMVVYVPIHVKGRWIGLFTFGPKHSGARYYDSDLTLLRTLADQTGIALENARLFYDLKTHMIRIEHLNSELAEANRKLTRLDQAKSDFIGVASHELRTPLTQVRGFNDILNDMASTGDLTPEMALQMTGSIRKSATRLQKIVDTMFDVSQIDTEMLDINASPNSLSSIINMVIEELSQAVDERKQSLTVEKLGNLPLITGDGQRLKQIFANLVQNAIKYTPDGGQIEVSGRLLDGEKSSAEQSVEMVVRDTGIGIAAEDVERLFEKFYRVDDASLHSTGETKFKGAGPGLGLTLARGLVEAHGGRIWAESPGHDEEKCPGSAFYVVLPLESGRLRVLEAA